MNAIKKNDAEKKKRKKPQENKIFLDKEFIYPTEMMFISTEITNQEKNTTSEFIIQKLKLIGVNH